LLAAGRAFLHVASVVVDITGGHPAVVAPADEKIWPAEHGLVAVPDR
jgi:hypothetical protein